MDKHKAYPFFSCYLSLINIHKCSIIILPKKMRCNDEEIKNWLIQIIQQWKPDIVGIEGIQLQQLNNKNVGVTTYQTLARLQGILMATCVEQNTTYKVCPPATWRSHCGVKGRTRADRKKSMQMKVKDWFDISVSDDVADAIGIGKYVSDTNIKNVKIFNWE